MAGKSREAIKYALIEIRNDGWYDEEKATKLSVRLKDVLEHIHTPIVEVTKAFLITFIKEKVIKAADAEILLMSLRLLRGLDDRRSRIARHKEYIEESFLTGSLLTAVYPKNYEKYKKGEDRENIVTLVEFTLNKKIYTQAGETRGESGLLLSLAELLYQEEDISTYIGRSFGKNYNKVTKRAILPPPSYLEELSQSTEADDLLADVPSSVHPLDNAIIPTIISPENAVHNFLVAKQFYESREFDKALPYLEKARDEQIRISGAMSIDVARTYNALGFSYKCLGNYRPAIDNLNHALAIIEKQGNEYWEEQGRLLYSRGTAYHGLDDTDRASDDINEAAEIVLANLPSRDVSDYISAIYLTAGKIMIDTGDPKYAVNRFDTALLHKEAYAPEVSRKDTDIPPLSIPYNELTAESGVIDFYVRDAELASILCNRALAYILIEKQDKAERDNNTALGVLDELPKSQQAILPVCHANSFFLALANGNVSAALDLISDAIAHSEKWNSKQHPYTGLMYEYQGNTLRGLKKYDDALQSHLAAYKIFLANNNQQGIDANRNAMEEIFEKNPQGIKFTTWLKEQLEQQWYS